MKNFFKAMIVVAAAATTFASCTKDPVGDGKPAPEKTTLRFTSGDPAESGAPERKSPETRTHFGDKYAVKWDTQDKIGLYIQDPVTAETVTVNAEGSLSRENAVAYFSATVTRPNEGDVLCAYYPFDAAKQGSAGSLELTVPAQQTQILMPFETAAEALSSFDGSSNPMVAVNYTFSAGEAADGTLRRPVKFRQLGAMGEFSVYTDNADYEGEVIRSFTFTNSASEAVAGTFTYDATSVDEQGEPAAIDKSTILEGQGSNSVTVTTDYEMAEGVSKDGIKNTLFLTVIPGEYTGNFVVTTDKATYTFADKTVDFQRAYVRRFSLNLANAVRKTDKPSSTVSVIDLASILAGGGTMKPAGTYSAPAWTTDGISYSADNVMQNQKNTPTNFTTGQILLLKKTDAHIYNTTAAPIRSITVYIAPAGSATTDADLTVATGNTQKPTTNTTVLSSLTPEIVSATYGTVTKNFAKYTVSLFGEAQQYFQIYSPSVFAALHKVEIEYGEPGPGVSVEGEKNYVIASTDVQARTFDYRVSNTTADAVMTQDEASKTWLTVTHTSKDDTGKGSVSFRPESENTAAEARTATITLAVAEGNTIAVTVTQNSAPVKLTMSALTSVVTDNSITVTWNQVEGATAYAYSLYTEAGTAVEGASGTTETLTTTFSSLTPSTAYTVKVKALGDNLYTSDSDEAVLEITTSSEDPKTVEGLTAYVKKLNPAKDKGVSVSTYAHGSITGYIAGNNANGNLINMISVVDNTGKPGSGILLFDYSNYTDATKFPIGAKVTIDLSAAEVKNYNSLYELMNAQVTVDESAAAEIVVPEITVAQLNSNDYMGMRVTVKEVTTQESGVWNATTGTASVLLKDAANASLTVRVAATASFKDVEYLSKTGNITGIAQIYGTTAQLFPQSADDVAAFDDTTPRIVSVDPAALNFTADGGTATITVNLKNKGENLLSADGLSGTLSATVDNTANTVTVTATANDTDQQIAQTLTIALANGNSIELPILQAGTGQAALISKTVFQLNQVANCNGISSGSSYSYTGKNKSGTFTYNGNVHNIYLAQGYWHTANKILVIGSNKKQSTTFNNLTNGSEVATSLGLNVTTKGSWFEFTDLMDYISGISYIPAGSSGDKVNYYIQATSDAKDATTITWKTIHMATNVTVPTTTVENNRVTINFKDIEALSEMLDANGRLPKCRIRFIITPTADDYRSGIGDLQINALVPVE